MIAPIAWRDCSEKLLDLRAAVDGIPIEFDDDAHVRSLMSFATLAESMIPDNHLVELAECWVGLPLSQRADFWRRGTNDKPVHAQLLGSRSKGARLLETHVPDWLPKLIDATQNLFVPTVGYRIHWTWTGSPLGTSCIAWRDGRPDSTTGYLAMSSCPVSIVPAHDPDRTIARSAIDVLIAARDVVAADDGWREALDWNPTGHDLFEVEATLKDWRGRLI
jgi:hypothetical protein